ncbi:hypothetical protein U1Q18_026852, partial [Sarracenia purpurea var. burkii]
LVDVVVRTTETLPFARTEEEVRRAYWNMQGVFCKNSILEATRPSVEKLGIPQAALGDHRMQ